MAEAPSPTVEAQPPATTFALPTDDELAASADIVVSDEPPSTDELPTLSQIRDDTWAQMERLPEAEWSIPALAESLQYDPQAAFAFVRDSIAFDPYPGVLRGAAGTLAARAGNAYDRALLLGALLDAMLVPHRFAFADLPDEITAAVLARATQPPTAALTTGDISLTTTIDPAALEQRARRDYARLRSVLDGALDGTPSTTPAGGHRRGAAARLGAGALRQRVAGPGSDLPGCRCWLAPCHGDDHGRRHAGRGHPGRGHPPRRGIAQ